MNRATRIYALLARSSSTAVVFRRGPSKQVLVGKWDTSSDTFEWGQWLKGRIYERRCDVSPDGEFLLYFAGNQRPPYRTWTAISRVPYLTALALWPKGDAWGGGGLFERRSRAALNHWPNQMQLAEGFSVPRWMSVGPFGEYPGRGEDDPIWSERLSRDGWIRASRGTIAERDREASVWIRLDPPLIWEKAHSIEAERYTLQMRVVGIKERNGPWYQTEHSVWSEGEELLRLGRSEWADWDHSGDLLFSKQGALYRVPHSRRGLAAEPRQVIDLSDMRFEARVATEEAKRWPRR